MQLLSAMGNNMPICIICKMCEAPAAICAAGYVRTQGRGRVCVLTPGHNLPVWLNPQFQKLLTNALNWCAPVNRN